jgi:hypothetical protein
MLLLALAACNRPAARLPATGDVRDGTALRGTVAMLDGVTTVSFPADAFDRATQLVIDTTPMAVIGGPGAPPDFDLTEAAPPVLLGSGGYASLVSIGGGYLLIFDSTGKPLRRVGRPGQGPGEFTRPSGPVLLGGDTLLVPDAANRRLNYFRGDGGLIRTVAMASPNRTDYMIESPIGRVGTNRLAWYSPYLRE